jgi:hypothetical protein
VRSFQSCASGVVGGVHESPAPAIDDGTAEGEDGARGDASADGDGAVEPHAAARTPHARIATRPGARRRTAAVYPRPGRVPRRPTIDWQT